jgi:hypothetical protein
LLKYPVFCAKLNQAWILKNPVYADSETVEKNAKKFIEKSVRPK